MIHKSGDLPGCMHDVCDSKGIASRVLDGMIYTAEGQFQGALFHVLVAKQGPLCIANLARDMR